jgi:hypothetical protein
MGTVNKYLELIEETRRALEVLKELSRKYEEAGLPGYIREVSERLSQEVLESTLNELFLHLDKHFLEDVELENIGGKHAT